MNFKVSKDEGGYYHTLNGVELYSERYQRLLHFTDEGNALVITNEGFYTHIDTQGKLIHDKLFYSASEFKDGITNVVDSSGAYHINNKGEPLYEERYQMVYQYNEDVAVARDWNNDEFHIDKYGKPIYTERYKIVAIFSYGRCAVYTKDNKRILINKKGERVELLNE